MRTKCASVFFFVFVSILSLACSSSDDSKDGQPPDRSNLEVHTCPPSGPNRLVGVKAGDAADYLEVRMQPLTADAELKPSGDPQTIASAGTACATAKDEPACKKALADLRPAKGYQEPCGGCALAATYLVF